MTGWLAVDPGQTWCGMVLRHRGDLIDHRVLHRVRDEDVVPGRGVRVGPAWLDEVTREVEDLELVWHRHTTGWPAHRRNLRIAVEGVVPPNPHLNRRNGKSLTDPTAIIGAGMVLGAILVRWPDAVVVPPTHHGAGALCSYPEALVTRSERARGLARPAKKGAAVSHARAAWDQSLAAPAIAHESDVYAARTAVAL